MIIFINGAFGVGKTTSAQRIVQRLPNSMLYDPEEIGVMLWKMLRPIGLDGDFQDYVVWRPLIASVAYELRQAYNRTLVIPMTIWRADYFIEVMNGLRLVDPDVYHFCLVAPVETIHQRLRERGGPMAGSWPFERTISCVDAFQSSLFDERIDAMQRMPDDIVSHILQRLGARA